jgi:hypothetical protein
MSLEGIGVSAVFISATAAFPLFLGFSNGINNASNNNNTPLPTKFFCQFFVHRAISNFLGRCFRGFCPGRRYKE